MKKELNPASDQADAHSRDHQAHPPTRRPGLRLRHRRRSRRARLRPRAGEVEGADAEGEGAGVHRPRQGRRRQPPGRRRRRGRHRGRRRRRRRHRLRRRHRHRRRRRRRRRLRRRRRRRRRLRLRRRRAHIHRQVRIGDIGQEVCREGREHHFGNVIPFGQSGLALRRQRREADVPFPNVEGLRRLGGATGAGAAHGSDCKRVRTSTRDDVDDGRRSRSFSNRRMIT